MWVVEFCAYHGIRGTFHDLTMAKVLSKSPRPNPSTNINLAFLYFSSFLEFGLLELLRQSKTAGFAACRWGLLIAHLPPLTGEVLYFFAHSRST